MWLMVVIVVSRRNINKLCYWIALSTLAFVSMIGLSAPSVSSPSSSSYSASANQIYPKTVYWGDTHLHTNLSADAYISGNRLTSDDAYRLALGKTVLSMQGVEVKLDRPLDFLVIADHAENLAVHQALEDGDPSLLQTEQGKEWLLELKKIWSISDWQNGLARIPYKLLFNALFKEGEEPVGDIVFRESIWSQVASKADQYNYPGQFTAFSGYEWTSGGQQLGNLHRVVMFKDDSSVVTQMLPFSSSTDSNDPEKLWDYMESYERQTGGEVFAIPHNSNVSNGEMFGLSDFAGNPLSRKYSSMRSRWEPLLEVTQIKGDSESHPYLSPTDEFSDYETWDTWAGKDPASYEPSSELTRQRKKQDYARSGLKLGLQEQARTGVNPFKFGLIGSTDAHTSLPAIDESNFWGKMPWNNPRAERITEPLSNFIYDETNDEGGDPPGWQMSSAGYAAVWAEENTRESLFAAMKRREVYATTGPRIRVRFFGGWDYHSDDAFHPDLARIGYIKGVPMGGDLVKASIHKSPSFLIRAIRDPVGANLDRVQVIKGWQDQEGQLHEKIYNVALSDNRSADVNGNVAPVGSTVNIQNASYTNSIGDPELAVVWQDPDFDRNQLAFYYLRVLEIPTPRWTAYDVKFFGIKDVPADLPMVTQERAYSSPIWYTP